MSPAAESPLTPTRHPQGHRDFPKVHVIAPVWDHHPRDLVEGIAELQI